VTGNIISNSAPLVLIADDLPEVIRDYEVSLAEYGVEVVKATTLDELYTVFDEYKHLIAAVILDGCIPGHHVNTTWFVRNARRDGFVRPIIAASSLPEYRDEMVRAGCSHQAPKWDAVELVADLLSTP
jgi:hypothetical protein